MKTRFEALLLLPVSIVLIACATTPPLDFDSIMGQGTIYTDPVLTNGVEDDAWDTGLVDPGAMIVHDGELHMFYNGIPGWPAEVAVGYATSPDGVEWARMTDEPVFSPQDADVLDSLSVENMLANSVIVDDDGQWVLYFTVSELPTSLSGNIARATAPSPTGPWTVYPNPVLSPGEPGEWDAVYVEKVDVLKVDDQYIMYYAASSGGIGRAVSADGIEWTKYNDPGTHDPGYEVSDPVMEGDRLTNPNVERVRDQWVMVFESQDGLNLAISQDGIEWEEYEENPIMTSEQIDNMVIYYSSMVVYDDQMLVYFEAGSTVGTDIYLAAWPLPLE